MAELQTNVKQGGLIGGWVCFGVGTAFMFLSLLTVIFYAPLFLAAFVLSIVAMSQRRVAGGLILLLCCVIIPPLTFFSLMAHRAAPSIESATAIAKTMRVQADVEAIKKQLQLYESISGSYPTTEQGLQALVTQPQNDPRPARWYQLFKELPKDPWGNEYIYRSPGLKNPSGYDLYSAGADRQADTADDDWGGG